MIKRSIAAAFALAALSTTAAHAQCTSYPYNLANGATADASQVMANFNCAALTSSPAFSGSVSVGGRLGVGTTSPGNLLEVKNSGLSSPGIVINNTTTWWQLDVGVNTANDSSFAIYNPSAGNAFVINSSGNIGIGATTISMPGSWKIPNLEIYSQVGGPALGLYINNTDPANAIVFNNPYGEVGFINTQGYSTGYGTSSDRRLKENVAPTARGLDELMKISILDFNFRADPKKHRVQGLIAQDIYQVYPEAVMTNGDNGVAPLANGAAAWGIDYGRLTPLLIKSIQELKNSNDSLSTTITQQKADLQAQQSAIKALQQQVAALGGK